MVFDCRLHCKVHCSSVLPWSDIPHYSVWRCNAFLTVTPCKNVGIIFLQNSDRKNRIYRMKTTRFCKSTTKIHFINNILLIHVAYSHKLACIYIHKWLWYIVYICISSGWGTSRSFEATVKKSRFFRILFPWIPSTVL